MRLKVSCEYCGKQLIQVSRTKLSETEILVEYKCGHAAVEVSSNSTQTLDFNAANTLTGKAARDYQKEGIEFIINANFNYLLGDQMRLGKTPQALLALKNAYAERTPCLILVRATNLWQWVREYKVWTDTLPLGIYPIVGSKSFIPPGFSAYIMSMDTFSREGMVEKLLAFGFKSVIVDEAHSFKNPSSNRSQALVQFLHDVSKSELVQELTFNCPFCKDHWIENIIISIDARNDETNRRVNKSTKCPSCGAAVAQAAFIKNVGTRTACSIGMLTGTPIKNRAEEFFIPLNLIAPKLFPSKERFRWDWLTQDASGKWSRIRPDLLDDFKELIKPFYLRREKEDVYTDLPKIDRMFTVIRIEDEKLKKLYNKALDKLEEVAARSNYGYFDTIGECTVLRKICGMAKVDFAYNYVDLFLEENEKAKIAIGIHHHDVANSLLYKLGRFRCVHLSGLDSAERKDYIQEVEFKKPENRVLVINELAGGVGMDFHYCDDVLVLERQWNAADEEQFEFRFYNPDKSIKSRNTSIEYLIAQGTIDEWWYDMVEEKRQIFGETVGTNWTLSEDKTSFKKLVERTLSARL